MRIAYARVSTDTQSEHTSALEQQIARLQSYHPDKILSDVDSGLDQRRQGYNTLLSLIEQNEVTVVIVTRLDRLNRHLISLIKFFDLAEEKGVSVIALDESIDTSSSMGKFYLRLIGSLAQMESERISERVKHGFQHLKNLNKATHPPFGYSVKDNHHIVDYTEVLCTIEDKNTYSYHDLARVYVEVFLICKSLTGTIRIFNKQFGILLFDSTHADNRRRLGFSHSSSFKKWLLNPVLLGHIRYNTTTTISALSSGKQRKGNPPELWDIRYDTHTDEALLTYTERALIDEILAKNTQSKGFGNKRRKHPSAGLIFCEACKSRMHTTENYPRDKKNKRYYYRCRQLSKGLCSNTKYIRLDTVHQKLFTVCLQELEIASQKLVKPKMDSSIVDDKIKELELQIAGLDALGYNPVFENTKRSIQEQIKNMQSQTTSILANYFLEEDRLLKYQKIANDYLGLPIGDLDNVELTDFFYFFIDKVWVLSGEILDIQWKDR
jgi:DNA invertase Pin-like site-specific DNA recombinase